MLEFQVQCVLKFCEGDYIFICINRLWRSIYKRLYKQTRTWAKFYTLRQLQYAHQNDYMFSLETYYSLIKIGNVSSLRWLYFTEVIYPDLKCFQLAIKHNHLELLKWLTFINPFQKTNLLYSICTSAIEYNRPDILKWLIENGYEFGPSKIHRAILENNPLEIIQWLWNRYEREITVQKAAEVCCYHGRLDVLLWILSRHVVILRNADILTCILRSENVSLELLRQAVHDGHRFSSISIKACDEVISTGRVDLIEYLVENGANLSVDTLRLAINQGKEKIALWIISNHHVTEVPDVNAIGSLRFFKRLANLIKVEWTEASMDYMSEIGDLEGVKWLREMNCPWGQCTAFKAISGRHFTLFKWIVENGCSVPKEVIDSIVRLGELELIVWLIGKRLLTSLSLTQISIAASKGHIHILRWAKKNNHWFGYSFCWFAARGKHLDVLKWMMEDNLLVNEEVCSAASEIGCLDLLKWARNNGCPWTRDVCEIAFELKQSRIFWWAFENNCSCLVSLYFAQDGQNRKMKLSKIEDIHGRNGD